MKVNYPLKLEILLRNQKDSPISFNFGPKIPDSIKEQFTNYTIPGNFAKYELHSSFLVSYWRAFTSASILILASFLFDIAAYIA